MICSLASSQGNSNIDLWPKRRRGRYERNKLFLPSVDAGGSGRTVNNVVTLFPALKHDLPVVLDLADVWTVIVKTHVAHKQNLEDEGKRTIIF